MFKTKEYLFEIAVWFMLNNEKLIGCEWDKGYFLYWNYFIIKFIIKNSFGIKIGTWQYSEMNKITLKTIFTKVL